MFERENVRLKPEKERKNAAIRVISSRLRLIQLGILNWKFFLSVFAFARRKCQLDAFLFSFSFLHRVNFETSNSMRNYLPSVEMEINKSIRVFISMNINK